MIQFCCEVAKGQPQHNKPQQTTPDFSHLGSSQKIIMKVMAPVSTTTLNPYYITLPNTNLNMHPIHNGNVQLKTYCKNCGKEKSLPSLTRTFNLYSCLERI